MRKVINVKGGAIVFSEDGVVLRRDYDAGLPAILVAFHTDSMKVDNAHAAKCLGCITFALEHGMEALAAKLGLPVLEITPEEAALQEYAEGDASCCPFCKSARINGESFEVDGPCADQPITCEICGSSWSDSYRREGAFINNLTDYGRRLLCLDNTASACSTESSPVG